MGSHAITILDRTTGRAVEAELLDGLVPEDLMLLESEWVSERSRVLQELLRAGGGAGTSTPEPALELAGQGAAFEICSGFRLRCGIRRSMAGCHVDEVGHPLHTPRR